MTVDVVCPWCYIGKRRFERALKLLDTSSVDVVVNWLPFQLAPDMGASVDKGEYYKRRFGDGIAPRLAHVSKVGEEEGINIKFGGKVGNTLSAHRLLSLAHARGGPQTQAALGQAIYNSYFERNEDIADPAVLATVVGRSGVAGTLRLDASGSVESFLASDELKSETRKAAQQSALRGVSGVPFFALSIDGGASKTYGVSGAEEPATFKQVFEKLGLPTVEAK